MTDAVGEEISNKVVLYYDTSWKRKSSIQYKYWLNMSTVLSLYLFIPHLVHTVGQFSLFTFETKCSGLKKCNILYECRFILKNKVAYLCLALVIFNFKYFTGFDIERTLLQIVSKHISQTAFPSRLRVSESQTDLETTRHRSYRAEKKKIRLGVLKYSTFNDTMGLMGFVP